MTICQPVLNARMKVHAFKRAPCRMSCTIRPRWHRFSLAFEYASLLPPLRAGTNSSSSTRESSDYWSSRFAQARTHKTIKIVIEQHRISRSSGDLDSQAVVFAVAALEALARVHDANTDTSSRGTITFDRVSTSSITRQHQTTPTCDTCP